MAIFEEKAYGVQCDRCREIFESPISGFKLWCDNSHPMDEAQDYSWIEHEDRYNQLASKKMPEGKDMVNCYHCRNCGNILKTINRNDGVTPFIIRCEKCGGEATSTFYLDICPDKPATHEWYRPSLKFVLNTTPSIREHVLNGGLLLHKKD